MAKISPIVDFDQGNSSKKTRKWGDPTVEGDRVRGFTKDGRQGILPEEAVMKIVENIDSTAVSAEAMQLTQVGYIDLLRQI